MNRPADALALASLIGRGPVLACCAGTDTSRSGPAQPAGD